MFFRHFLLARRGSLNGKVKLVGMASGFWRQIFERCQEYKGILAGHAYTLLRLVEVPLVREAKKEEESILKLVHVRNPHATNEWCGRFHDDDWETWHKYPEALKATGHTVPWMFVSG